MSDNIVMLVSDVKLLAVDRSLKNQLEWLRYDEMLAKDISTGEMFGVKVEEVTGRIFTNNRGENVTIGMTKAVQESICLSFEAFDKMEKSLNSYRLSNICLNRKILKYDNMSFWKRLKFLVKGKVETNE